MSLGRVSKSIREIAQTLRDTPKLLEKSGEILASEVRGNVHDSSTGGPFRNSADFDHTPGTSFTKLSQFTLKERERNGIFGVTPLIATGQLLRDIGTRKTGSQGLVVKVGPKTRRSRDILRKQMGTNITGILSSTLQRSIPARNPMGYDQATLRLILSLWENALSRSGNVSVAVTYEVGVSA
jgi:hypothetical protein